MLGQPYWRQISECRAASDYQTSKTAQRDYNWLIFDLVDFCTMVPGYKMMTPHRLSIWRTTVRVPLLLRCFRTHRPSDTIDVMVERTSCNPLVPYSAAYLNPVRGWRTLISHCQQSCKSMYQFLFLSISAEGWKLPPLTSLSHYCIGLAVISRFVCNHLDLSFFKLSRCMPFISFRRKFQFSGG